MKIYKINFYHLKSGIVIVIIQADDGTEGIGQFIGNSFKSQINYYENNLRKILINKNINLKEIWDQMYWNGLGKNGWIQVIAAIDIALHDLIAKKKEKPLFKLFKSKNNNVKMYWSIGHGFEKTIKEMQKKIDIGLNKGFKAFKIRMDWHELRQNVDPQKDFKMLKAVRLMLPTDYYLGFDANGGYSVETAINQGKKFEDLGGISHFEEPISTNDLFGLKKVAKSLKIPISFGEYEKTASRFKEIIELANPDIIQPDILNIGGISQLIELCKLSKKYKKKIMPHSPNIGILSFASLHFYSLYGSNLPHEFSPELYNYRMSNHARLFNENILPKDGHIMLNNNFGIGLTINKKELKKQTINK